ncbi:unnamed protein product [Brassica oleracea]
MVMVLEMGNETFDVNGFQVSTSQLSDDDLAEASAAVLYLSQVGLKVDWLEEKLEELKEKKKKMYTGKAQLQRMEEELQNLTKKCSDLEDLVKKQNVALSFSDVV